MKKVLLQTGLKTTLRIWLLILLSVLVKVTVFAQNLQFNIIPISLPEEIQNPDHEFSGLYISGKKLFLLPENRDKGAGKLFALNLSDLDCQLSDSSFRLPFETIYMKNLEQMKDKMKAEGNAYEGMEAILIDGNIVYLSVETTTPSAYCYLLKGTLRNASLIIENQFLLQIKKPIKEDGSQVYNTGFESLIIRGKEMIAFFEFNNFRSNNYAYTFNTPFLNKKSKLLPFQKNFPFRITDLTDAGAGHYTGINYFYKGGGPDTLYRPAIEDSINNNLVKSKSGYQNYCRLVDISFKGDSIYWNPLWEFPATYTGYNWEGIAAYKNGYFIINDRYTRERPYRSTLIYLDGKKN